MQQPNFKTPLLTQAPATWKYMPQVDLWVWFPQIVPINGDLNTILALKQKGHQRIDPGSAETFSLIAQLRTVAYLREPSSEDLEQWALTSDIAAAKETPVALAFKLPEHARQVLPTIPSDLPIALPFPPPQFGEVAFVDNGQDWVPYTLSTVGSDGLDLWRRMGEKLKALASPAEWWLYTPYTQFCSEVGGYEQVRSALLSELLAAKDDGKREQVRSALQALDAARKQVRAIEAAAARRKKNFNEFLTQWREIKTMAHELARLYWQTHIAITTARQEQANQTETESVTPREVLNAEIVTTEGEADGIAPSSPEEPKGEEAVALSQMLTTASANSLDTPSYAEDRAAREAMLSDKHEWKPEEGLYRFNTSNNFAVYFGDPNHPLGLEDAQAQLINIRESTVLTVRIALGIWNLRRHNSAYMRNGGVLIPYDEILAWRGVPKHSYTEGGKHTTDGYRMEDREAIRSDFALARMIYLRGEHTVYVKGKSRQLISNGVYVNATLWSTPSLFGPSEHPLGVTFRPGDWIGDYDDANNIYLAEIDRRVFQLAPHNEQHELKIALYLTELWRYSAHKGTYGEPISMSDLLARSVISVNNKNLTNRFIPRIEQALETLRTRGIVSSYECLTPPDRSKSHWGKDWLASRWRIMPPDELTQSYAIKGITQGKLPSPTGKQRRH